MNISVSQKELLKSLTLGLVALIALMCWINFHPRQQSNTSEDQIGRKLLEGLDNLEKITQIQLIRIEAETGQKQELLIRKEGSDWILPSFSGFSAENSKKLTEILTPLLQLTILDIVRPPVSTEDSKGIRNFHSECGVLSPGDEQFEYISPKDSSTGGSGAGLEVILEGEDHRILLDLLIGNRAPESSYSRDARFVRFPQEDYVYVVDFIGESTQETVTAGVIEYTDRVSFSPTDYVDPDLLRISRWDILNMTMKDYTLAVQNVDDNVVYKNLIFHDVLVFKQTPDNPSSKIWSLQERYTQTSNAGWQQLANVDPSSANNTILNETADLIGKLKFVDVSRKPLPLAKLFSSEKWGTELTTQSSLLSEFGFCLLESDPVDPSRIEPILGGEGGSIELTTRSGLKIVLVFGREQDNKRAVIAYAKYSREALSATLDSEEELTFLESEAREKAAIKNARFSNWFYLIDEQDFQKIRFRVQDVLN